MHAILISGFRSITHTTKVMERYTPMIKSFTEECPISCLIDTVADVWQSSTLRVCLILEKMIGIEILSGEDIIEWAFNSSGIASIGTGEEVLKCWDLIECAVSHEVAAVSEAKDEIARAEMSVKDAEVDIRWILTTRNDFASNAHVECNWYRVLDMSDSVVHIEALRGTV